MGDGESWKIIAVPDQGKAAVWQTKHTCSSRWCSHYPKRTMYQSFLCADNYWLYQRFIQITKCHNSFLRTIFHRFAIIQLTWVYRGARQPIIIVIYTSFSDKHKSRQNISLSLDGKHTGLLTSHYGEGATVGTMDTYLESQWLSSWKR